MNGATALPCAKISRAPRSSIIRTIGTSQNFFRVFRKSHNSASMDIISTLELLRHSIGSRSGRLAANPIGVGLRHFQTQGIVAQEPRDESNWGEDQEKENSGYDRVHDSP